MIQVNRLWSQTWGNEEMHICLCCVAKAYEKRAGETDHHSPAVPMRDGDGPGGIVVTSLTRAKTGWSGHFDQPVFVHSCAASRR